MLKTWAGEDGRLVEFSKPFGNLVKPKRVFPSQTAYVENLYTLRGFPSELSTQVEQKFLQPVDSEAATVLQRLIAGEKKSDLSNREATAWTKFLLSLLLRMPEDLEHLRLRWAEKLQEISLEHRILPAKKGSDRSPDLFSHAVANPPVAEFDEMVFNVFVDLLNSDVTGNHLVNMFWGVTRFADLRHKLYLSDRPIVRLSALSDRNGAMILPISPTSLFVAANSETDLKRYLGMNSLGNLRDANLLIVSQATKYSYSTYDTCLRFMQNHLATVHDQRAMQGTSFLRR